MHHNVQSLVPSQVMDRYFHLLSNYHPPMCSMYAIFANICPKNQPNVGKYSIHGASVLWSQAHTSTQICPFYGCCHTTPENPCWQHVESFIGLQRSMTILDLGLLPNTPSIQKSRWNRTKFGTVGKEPKLVINSNSTSMHFRSFGNDDISWSYDEYQWIVL